MRLRRTLLFWIVVIFLGFQSLSLYSREPFGSQTTTSGPTVIQANATRTLLNGLRIEILSAPQYPRVSIHLLIGAGSALDPQDKVGLAELTMATLLDSIPDWQGDPAEIGKILEAGKNFQYEVDWDTTHLFVECQPEQIDVYFQALTRLVRYATLSTARFESARNRLIKVAEEEKRTPKQWAERSFESILFRGNPYARPLKGTVGSLKKIVFGDTVNFQKKYHLPNVSFLSVVGPIQADTVRSLAGRSLGIWIMDRAFPYTFTPPPIAKELHLVTLNAPPPPESILLVGQLIVPRSSSSFVSAELLANILQSTRWESCPDVKANSELTGRKLKGFLRVSVQKQDLPVRKILQEVRQRWQQLTQNGPSPEEGGLAVNRYLETLQEKAQSAPFLARMLCLADAFQLGFNFYERTKQVLPKTTPTDLRLAAQKLLTPDQLLAVIYGPVPPSDIEELRKEGWQISAMDLPGRESKP